MEKICSQCSAPFEITQEDLAFLESISPIFNGKKELIPPPTLCSDCRVQRRMAQRNDRTFYHRTCDLTGAKFVSMYAPDTTFPVYKQDAWHSDRWDALDFGRDVDFSRPFFDQWADLNNVVPHWGVAISNCENSDYCNYCTDEKNCYLDIAAEGNEDCYYNLFVKNSRNSVDCTFVYRSTLCHECIQCYDCYGLRNAQYMDNCTDCAFCFDCKGCKDCLLCINQRGKQYCIMNEQFSKEDYEKRLKELRLDRHSSLAQVADIWKKMRIEKGIYRDMYNIASEGCTGNDIKNSKNCDRCFNATDCEDCSCLYDVLTAKNCRDINYSLYNPQADYEVISTVGLTNSAFYMAGPYNTGCFYGHMLQSCTDCFGCIGLKQKKHCILNKQYTKEEYEVLVPKLIEHMRGTGEWGEFFPIKLSPHGYNETVACEYMPLTKEEVLQRGWPWRDEPVPNQEYMGPPVTLPDAIADVAETICGSILTCEASRKQYKIIPQELKFYRQLGIPLPRRAPAQRHNDRNALRNPRRLWDRECMNCKKKIQTSYAPDRPEIVYCEECYLKTVY